MKFMHRYRRLISIVSVLTFLLAGSVTPASAIYNPRTGKWMQRDPNGVGVVLQPNLSYHARNPVITVSVAYELQYGDGMNFYEYLRSNPPNGRDPAGLFTLLDTLITSGLAGGLYGLANDYSHFNDNGSNWRLAAAFAKGAGMGAMAGMGFGLLSGALAGYAGISIGAASASIGLIVSPGLLGMSIKKFHDAGTYADRVMAAVDIGGAGLSIIASHTAAFKFVGGATAANPFRAIRTPRELVKQSLAPDALALRSRVSKGLTLYRIGTRGTSHRGSAQFWAPEDPSTPGFANKYGLPPRNVRNPDFMQVGTLKPGAKFVIRVSPGSGGNSGGALEVVTEIGGVSWTQTPFSK